MLEVHLIKLLEYGNISTDQSIRLIGETLNLEYYFDTDTQIHTLSSEYFVIDILNEKCTLIFVEEGVADKHKYIEAYLNNSFRSMVIFFYLLKYLCVCSKKTFNSIQKDDCSEADNCKKYKNSKESLLRCICGCIFLDKYCEIYNLLEVENDFNVFSHSTLRYPIDLYFDSPLVKKPDSEISKLEQPENFSEIFTNSNYSKNVWEYFKKDKDYFYKSSSISVLNTDVIVEDLRSPIASLAFARGCTLSEALEIARDLN